LFTKVRKTLSIMDVPSILTLLVGKGRGGRQEPDASPCPLLFSVDGRAILSDRHFLL
jgi:hypothetical protein